MTGSDDASRLVCVGVIGAPHGVRGLVKIRPFTEAPDSLPGYAPFVSQAGRPLPAITFRSLAKGMWLAAIDAVSDREAADALRGTELYIPRDRLPPTEEDDFYYSDLIGLRAYDPHGNQLGTVLAIHDFGAGDLLEIGQDKRNSMMTPFTREAVPAIERERNRLTVAMPPGLDDKMDENPDATTEDAS